jgi:hypothetical protein
METTDKQVLISGSFVNSKSGVAAFVGLIDSLNTIKWIKTYKPGKADYYGLLCKPANDGFVLALQANSQKSQAVILMSLDFNGNIKTTREINTASVPEILLYDDVNLTTLLACKGKKYNNFSVSDDSLRVYLFDTGLNILREKYLWFDGYLSNIIKSNNRSYIFGSFNKLNKPDDTHISLESGVSNVFLNTLDVDGNSLQFKTFPDSFSYFPLKINKINSDLIDVMSLKGVNPADASINDINDLKPHYFIVNTQGSVTFLH